MTEPAKSNVIDMRKFLADRKAAAEKAAAEGAKSAAEIFNDPFRPRQ